MSALTFSKDGCGTYSFVAGVHEDDLVVFVDTVLVDPVRVEDTEVATSPANTLLSSAPQAALELEVVDTLADGLAVGSTWTASHYPFLKRFA